MTDKKIMKALECCINADSCCTCRYTKMCDGTTIHQFALDLINRQQAEIERLQKQICALGGLPKMALPYDEDEFLRKAILEVIKWIEEMPNYKIFGTIVLTKTRVDEMKDRIKGYTDIKGV